MDNLKNLEKILSRKGVNVCFRESNTLHVKQESGRYVSLLNSLSKNETLNAIKSTDGIDISANDGVGLSLIQQYITKYCKKVEERVYSLSF